VREWEEALLGGIDGFVIVPSESGQRGVGIPNDVAICDACRRELFDPHSRRYLYPFINCTDCGARFTVIEDLPYDRANTSMSDFPMCDACREEYEDPSDRRFHHQTISCPACGPSYHLLEGMERMDEDPIAGFASRMDEGSIGIAKSWGGMHICCELEIVPRLREWYGRRQKPFAIMARNMEAVRRYARPSAFEEELLTSSHRPVTLIPKMDDELTEAVSPGLGSIGVFLPYTAMHEVLFHYLGADALVMTSANVPGEPMILDDRSVLSMGAECYLLHNRRIVNRCDDSVVRSFDDDTYFIRRSRGNVPVHLKAPAEGTTLGMGAQENITATLAFGGRMYPTQYIGDGSSLGVLDFLESAVRHQLKLLGVGSVERVAMDLHPGYSSRRLARSLSEELGAQPVQVQHHWAHAASLMVDAGIDEMVALTLDGTGYGSDGKAWGGEVLHTTFDRFERVGHLQEIPLLGGEKAVLDVRRILFAIQEMLGETSALYDEADAGVLRKMIPTAPRTTSFGRVLDALSCFFGICCQRSYDGEPAMKLEKLLERGRKTEEFDFDIDGGTIMTLPAFHRLMGMVGRKEDLARSFVSDLLSAMVDVAVERAEAKEVSRVGLTGGVAYNATISQIVKEKVESRGKEFVRHRRVPNGDGGISIGQAAIALFMD
jgi:hydrogenase maturation protein HypF